MGDIVDLNEYAKKRMSDEEAYATIEKALESIMMSPVVSFIDNVTNTIAEAGFDPSEQEVAENMIALSVLFSAQINHLNRIDDDTYDVLRSVTKKIYEDAENEENE